MQIEVRHVADCPHVAVVLERLQGAAREEDVRVEVVARVVQTLEEAARLGFVASPTIVIDGVDVSPMSGDPGLACRLAIDVPTTEHLRALIAERNAHP